MSTEYAPAALNDVTEIEDFLAQRGLRAVAVFQHRLLQTTNRLERLPLAAQLFEPEDPRHPGMRVCTLHRLPSFAVFYQPRPDGIRVLRVLHTSRDIAAIFTPPPSTD